MNFCLTTHSESEMVRRKIPQHLLEELMADPQQVVPGHGRRKVYQSLLEFGDNRTYLLRAIVDDQTSPPTIVTVYRTSRVRKYWRAT